MACGLAITYGIIILLTPFPNIAILSYYNDKPTLTKVTFAMVLYLYYVGKQIYKF